MNINFNKLPILTYFTLSLLTSSTYLNASTDDEIELDDFPLITKNSQFLSHKKTDLLVSEFSKGKIFTKNVNLNIIDWTYVFRKAKDNPVYMYFLQKNHKIDNNHQYNEIIKAKAEDDADPMWKCLRGITLQIAQSPQDNSSQPLVEKYLKQAAQTGNVCGLVHLGVLLKYKADNISFTLSPHEPDPKSNDIDDTENSADGSLSSDDSKDLPSSSTSDVLSLSISDDYSSSSSTSPESISEDKEKLSHLPTKRWNIEGSKKAITLYKLSNECFEKALKQGYAKGDYLIGENYLNMYNKLLSIIQTELRFKDLYNSNGLRFELNPYDNLTQEALDYKKKALYYLEKAGKNNIPDAYLTLYSFFNATKKLKKAKKWAEKAYNSDVPNAIYTYINILQEVKDYKKAKEIIQKMIQTNPLGGFYSMAQLYEKMIDNPSYQNKIRPSMIFQNYLSAYITMLNEVDIPPSVHDSIVGNVRKFLKFDEGLAHQTEKKWKRKRKDIFAFKRYLFQTSQLLQEYLEKANVRDNDQDNYYETIHALNEIINGFDKIQEANKHPGFMLQSVNYYTTPIPSVLNNYVRQFSIGRKKDESVTLTSFGQGNIALSQSVITLLNNVDPLIENLESKLDVLSETKDLKITKYIDYLKENLNYFKAFLHDYLILSAPERDKIYMDSLKPILSPTEKNDPLSQVGFNQNPLFYYEKDIPTVLDAKRFS